ncbi:uncharacterized protein LOC119376840 [Rhipicephalus sanguineus]|uniref:uncharacterized protein LOC119376840 n=1 Tax=Rhipicephalus sanguineus TaxID=34632 RepID=UPI001895DB64|nr:uncharacterized protein LOC119376840 [Rhipicephalus sanguineus]
MAMAVLLLLGLNVLVGALGSPRQAISRTERRDMDLARAATFRRFRRDVEEKNGNLDRVVCVLLELGSPWCEKGMRDTAAAAALEDGTGRAEDEPREGAALPCRSPTCKLFTKRKKQEKRRPPEQSPDSQFYSGW